MKIDGFLGVALFWENPKTKKQKKCVLPSGHFTVCEVEHQHLGSAATINRPCADLLSYKWVYLRIAPYHDPC